MGYAFILLVLGTWAWSITRSKSPCSGFEFEISTICELLDRQPCSTTQEMVIIHVDPACHFCFILLKELSVIKTAFEIYLVSYGGYLETQKFADQFPWINRPKVILATKPLVEKAFCSSATPSVLVFAKGALIYSKLGLGKTSELQFIIGQ